jgi:parallel beta-helix repeat protein
MKRRTHLAIFAAVFMAVTAVPASLYASTLYVGSCGSPTKSTIQAAVNASSPGDTVLVCPGIYPEQVTINKNLTLLGLVTGTAGQVVITSPAGGVVRNTYDLYRYGDFPVAAQVLVQNARQLVLNNITVDGANNGISGCALDIRGIYYQNASGTIENVATRNQVLSAVLTGCQSGQGIFVQSGYGSSTPQYVAILNNSVHAFQKNGITVDGSPLTFLVQKNYIVGQGPTNGAAENGVQISDGATGAVLNNTTIDEIWAPDTSSDTGDAASGILIYSSANVEIGFNTVGSTQFGIVTVSDPTYPSPQDPRGVADFTNIHDNSILGTQIFDGIDACSNNNTVFNNTVFSSTEAGIHLDSTCGSTGKNNTVTFNTINDACAGILQGGTPNNLGGGTLLGFIPLPGANTFYNDTNTFLAGDVCTPTPAPAVATFAASALSQVAAGTGTPHPRPVQ